MPTQSEPQHPHRHPSLTLPLSLLKMVDENYDLDDDDLSSASASSPLVAANAPPTPAPSVDDLKLVDPWDLTKYTCVRVLEPERYSSCVITFTFLAEGAANAVFQILPYAGRIESSFMFVEDGMPVPYSLFLNKVLRVSKGVPKTLSFRDVVRGFTEDVLPLFAPVSTNGTEVSYKEYLLEDEGVSFDGGLASHLHTLMHGEDCAPQDCERIPAMEHRGLLLPDMTSAFGTSLTIEIKPKWLAQSPTAPSKSFKCRTCALQARRASKGKRQPLSYICPFKLVTGNAEAISDFLRPRILAHFKVNSANPVVNIDVDIEDILARATDYLARGPGHGLLKHMQKLQDESDPGGVCSVPKRLRENSYHCRGVRAAMTLRDCSMFIKVPYRKADGCVESKLADLDFKSMEKVPDWVSKEEALWNGGWYTNIDTQSVCAVSELWKETCPWWW
ncbi:hypothetical protein P280DRAFT_475368 [Massarina eburnea CBS 473.64]|uniref:Inositol-pentakisphosphate 2-kinase n=1 Tax=Massarina eburnea CBS 473.64 TaxID=1395130 RepID=A0A6A6SHM0_9PLEO|nr:hypothetical protein P280DRAFT_475368 [Massarina eburnea CBS 473.64]